MYSDVPVCVISSLVPRLHPLSTLRKLNVQRRVRHLIFVGRRVGGAWGRGYVISVYLLIDAYQCELINIVCLGSFLTVFCLYVVVKVYTYHAVHVNELVFAIVCMCLLRCPY